MSPGWFLMHIYSTLNFRAGVGPTPVVGLCCASTIRASLAALAWPWFYLLSRLTTVDAPGCLTAQAVLCPPRRCGSIEPQQQCSPEEWGEDSQDVRAEITWPSVLRVVVKKGDQIGERRHPGAAGSVKMEDQCWPRSRAHHRVSVAVGDIIEPATSSQS